MRRAHTTLYGLAAPLAFLPVMDFSFSQVGPFLKGPEFRNLIAEFVTQLLSGFAEAFIFLFSQASFGLLGAQ